VAAKASAPGLRHLRIERRGGFAGLPATADLDGEALTAGQRRALDSALASASRAGKPPPPSPDRYHYRIHTTDSQGVVSTVEIAEDAMPAALTALCQSSLP
jgi:hypothetical protein